MTAFIFLWMSVFSFLQAPTSQASCNPCICGPGGGVDRDEWIRENCGPKVSLLETDLSPLLSRDLELGA